MALSPHINIMLRAAEKAGRTLARDFGEVEQLQVSQKGPGDFVSAADRRSEEILYNELSKARPDYGFLMEESGDSKGPKDYEYRFIIDPLDGTTNFLHGIPHWCISIGLERKGEIIAGIILDPVKDEVFRAEKGMGAFMRNTRLRVSGRQGLKDALVATDRTPFDVKEKYMRESLAVSKFVPSLREMGSVALGLAYVAAGRFDGYWALSAKPWDMTAGALIAKEAGGMVSEVNGKSYALDSNNIIASNGPLFNDLKKLLQAANKGQEAA
ncbi:MAG: inositol monophosphatase [Rhodospirillales bacterium]|nr:inositol monophosphatase [Rhodospirillales bacterium]